VRVVLRGYHFLHADCVCCCLHYYLSNKIYRLKPTKRGPLSPVKAAGEIRSCQLVREGAVDRTRASIRLQCWKTS
jgi:hypothetical protein